MIESTHDDFAASLPAGERVLWTAQPRVRGIALRTFHLRKLGVYFAALLAWKLLSTWSDSHSVSACLLAAGSVLLLAAVASSVFALLSWLIARTTTYAITTRRVVLRFGVALPMTVNIPLRIIDSAALRAYADGTGDIPLTLSGDDRIAWLVLWPHVRAWRLRKPQPMLRAVPDAAAVARLLADALLEQPAVQAGPAIQAPVEQMHYA